MSISEPTTTITDYMVAGLALFFWWRLRSAAHQTDSRSQLWWSRAFMATAVGAVAGGTSHGFAAAVGELGWLILWKLTIYALAVASLCLLLSSLLVVFEGLWLRFWGTVAWAKLALYALLMIRRNDFEWVILDYGSSMVAVLLLTLWSWWRLRAPAARWIVAGILVSFLAARIQMSGLVWHRHFNHNDLFHLVQMVGLALFYRGGLQLRDAGEDYQR